MIWNAKVSVILACMITLSSAQEGLFGSLGFSGEGGSPFRLLPFIGFGPFGMFGGYGLSRQAEQVASEAAAASEGATERAAEGSGTQHPSFTDISKLSNDRFIAYYYLYSFILFIFIIP